MSAETGHTLVEVAGVNPEAPVTVSFPLAQPGASAFVGYYELADRCYVLKLPKTKQMLDWALGGHPVQEPPWVKMLRLARVKGNAFPPTPALWPTIEQFNETCQSWLSVVSPEDATEALFEVRGTDSRTAAGLVDELYQQRGVMSFAPEISAPVRLAVLPNGPRDVPGMVQEHIGSVALPARPFSRSIPSRELMPVARLLELEFLILLAYAVSLAERHGIGLDLAPRFAMGRFSVPNVLVRADGGLVYIDSFGLAQRDGRTIESGAFGAMYGRWGASRQLAAWMYRDLTRRSTAAMLSTTSRAEAGTR